MGNESEHLDGSGDFYSSRDEYERNHASSSESLIVVTQLPQIEQQLYLVKEKIESMAAAMDLEVTEETVKAAKSNLADARKIIKALESRRIAIKREILAPYDAMETVYRTCVTDIWKPAEDLVNRRISDYEDAQKERKRQEVVEYFNELCSAKGIDFIPAERFVGKIGLSTSVSSAKAQIKLRLDAVSADLEMIRLQEFADEIMGEYMQSLNAANSIVIVASRKEAMKEARKRREEQEAARASMAANTESVDKAALEFSAARMEAPEELEPPMAEEFPAVEPQAVEPQELNPPSKKIYRTSFAAWGDMDFMKDLKQFLESRAERYESI
jgi:TolA-binding protein